MKDSDLFIETVIGEKNLERLQAAHFQTELAEGINWLIEHNFEKLIYLLYRIDVSEEKIRKALTPSANTPTGQELARLIIDRLIQKMETRKQQASSDADESDSERW